MRSFHYLLASNAVSALFLANQAQLEAESQEDMRTIAELEQGVAEDIAELSSVLERAVELLAPNTTATTVADLKAQMPPDIKAAFERFAPGSKLAGGANSTSPPQVSFHATSLASALGPAMMVPLLQDMYDRFKIDITKATKSEQRAKDRVTKAQNDYATAKNAGKDYLLSQKQKLIEYYKRQQGFQHNHYHALLKLAHGMMERIKVVKGMCSSAAEGKKLNKKQQYELAHMSTPKGV